MRVLWFADVQLPAVTGVAESGGGWVEGLRRALCMTDADIELAVAAPGPVVHETLRVGGVTYYHIHHPLPEARIARAVTRWGHSPAPVGALRRCLEIVADYRPDIVHVHGSEHYFGLVAEVVQVPVVVSLQGIATVYERYSFVGLSCMDTMRMIPTRAFLRGDGPIHDHAGLRARAATERRIMASCDDFMGRTEWDRSVLSLLRPGGRYHEVGEVLAELFYLAEWSPERALDNTVYCTGGASALKGVECLLEALLLLRRSRTRAPRLRLAGHVLGGASAGKIRRLLAAPELNGAVDVLGPLPPDSIAKELTAAAMFVLPSHLDNSPNALCEAMLVGIPCIASYVGGVPSLVTDGVDGLLYQDSDPYALASKIDRLFGNPALAASLGARGRERARLRHDPRVVAGQALAAYGDVLGRTPSQGAHGAAGTNRGDP
jgi:glycosyltransferase involved in cell wall biosynthesis